MDPTMNELYREVILDHFQNPRHQGVLDEATLTVDGKNPLCGDEIILHLLMDGDGVREVCWSGHGCSICMASSSMLTEAVRGRSLAYAQDMIQAIIQMMHGKGISATVEMGDLEVLEGVSKFPVRIKCALLPWTTLQEGIRSYQRGDHEHASFSY